MLKYKFIIVAALAVTLASCSKDLNRYPTVQESSESVFKDPVKIKEAFGKLYSGLTLSGQAVGSSNDVTTTNGGATVYFRNWWLAAELPTDEAVISWNDGNLPSYHTMTWDSYNDKLVLWYNRIYFEVAQCNEFLRQSTDDKMSANGITGEDLANVQVYRLEARFLRALAYWHAIDNFGNVPFVTEADPVGLSSPKQISRADLFAYIESELKAIESSLPDPRVNEYGRADKACAWMLLAKLYLNAQVYIGQNHASDAMTYCNKIIASNAYDLSTNYDNIFKTDNRTTSKEIIFPIRGGGLNSQSDGNTSFLIHAKIGGSMTASDWGLASGWAGLRVTSALVKLYPDTTGAIDKRGKFYTNGQSLEITNIGTFTDGYAVNKFSNLSSTGAKGSDPSGTYSDLDFPMFRYADVLLMYAEANLRGGGGDLSTAVGYVNSIRERGYGSNAGDITASYLNLDFILAERGRELYWEGHRRTDLIRFGKFTSGNYVWPWKGGVAAGAEIASYRTLYPIPNQDIIANGTLKQNSGY